MANFVDALLGYEYYIDQSGKASFETVNDFLGQNNRNHISQRTYNHYRSLKRYGFSSYFPINQFDVSRTLGQLPISPDRRRYERENKNIDTKISSDRNIWFSAIMIDKSLVGFGMTTLQDIPMKDGDPIWIRMKQYHDIPAILVWKKADNKRIRFGVRAIEFIETYRITEDKIRPSRIMGKLIVRESSKVEISWQEIYNLMAKTEKLIDASSGLLKHIAKVINVDVKISPPVLSSIKFSSPGELIVIIDYKLIALLIILIRVIQLWKVEKERLKEETRSVKLDNDMKEIEIEIARKAIKLKKVFELDIIKQLLNEIPAWVKKVLNVANLPSNLFEPESLEKGMLKEQLLPVAVDMIAGDNPTIQVEVKENFIDKPQKN
ncbi:MAG: PilZ domain-containing protein [Deltaproteobacteria bacterium]|nr:PilZ domain-containing protein [Deltaproteobacteria bacterium]